MVAQLIKNFPTFMEPKGSSPCSQEPTSRLSPSQLNPVCAFTLKFCTLHFKLSHLPLGLSCDLFISGFMLNFIILPYVFHHLILLDGEKYKLWSTALCNFLLHPVSPHKLRDRGTHIKHWVKLCKFWSLGFYMEKKMEDSEVNGSKPFQI
jgi:hypothetical protein